MVYFSELKGRSVIDCTGNKIGILKDLVFIDGTEYAEISHLIYLSEEKYRKKISWRFVKEIENKGNSENIMICLNEPVSEINKAFEEGNEFLVGNLVDKQIVDLYGLKVVRVNDVLLGKVKSKFCIAAVCVGTKSLMKRMGVEKLTRIFRMELQEHIIPWQLVEPLEEGLHDIHIKYQKEKIADLHPSDIADIMEDLTPKERVLIFNSLDKDKAAKTLIESEPDIQSSFFKDLKINRFIELLETIPLNHGADILSLLPDERVKDILDGMLPSYAQKIREILKYPEESAGAIMHTNFVAVPEDFTSQKTINHLRKIKPHSEEMYHIYVVDKQNHLIGVLSVRALVTSPPKTMVSELMTKQVVKLKMNSKKDEMANAIAKYNLFALPVVDKDNTLKGIVKADDVLTEIMPESWKKRTFMIKKKRHGVNGNKS